MGIIIFVLIASIVINYSFPVSFQINDDIITIDFANGFDENWTSYITGPPNNEVPDLVLLVNYSIPKGNLSPRLESKYYLDFTGFCYDGSWIDMGFSSGASTFRENRTVSTSCLTYDNETLQIKMVLRADHDESGRTLYSGQSLVAGALG